MLYTFTGGSDGADPFAGLIFDSAGNLYSTTFRGGGGQGCRPIGCGVVFELSPPIPPATQWTETVLHTFGAALDGGFPYAGMIFDSKGRLYGTTANGGTSACLCGVVFKLTPPIPPATQWTETVLHSFGINDGAYPHAGLIADGKGRLYGTTEGGGASCLCGVVFKLTPPVSPATDWSETVLHPLGGRFGSHPYAGLIADSAGNLYGATFEAGAQKGVVFELAP